MTKAKQKIMSFLLVFSFIMLLFSASSVFAGGLLSTQEGFGAGGSEAVADVFDSGQPQDLRATVAKLIRAALGFLGVIFTFLIIYAGYLWMTAAGNDSKIDEAKKILSRSIVGLVIIMASYSISGLVICKIVDATSETVFSCMF